MKKFDGLSDVTPLARRNVLKAAAAGVALSAMPGAGLFAAARAQWAPSVAMGYWKTPATVNLSKANDVLVDALSVAPTAGSYALRILAAHCDTPLSIQAQYPGDAEHFFWQSWTEGGMLQQSQTTSIRWWAGKRAPLPLVITTAGGASVTQVTAQTGTYVLAIAPDAQKLPAWNALALQVPQSRTNTRNVRLLQRSSGAPVLFPHLIFSVQPIAV